VATSSRKAGGNQKGHTKIISAEDNMGREKISKEEAKPASEEKNQESKRKKSSKSLNKKGWKKTQREGRITTTGEGITPGRERTTRDRGEVS